MRRSGGTESRVTAPSLLARQRGPDREGNAIRSYLNAGSQGGDDECLQIVCFIPKLIRPPENVQNRPAKLDAFVAHVCAALPGKWTSYSGVRQARAKAGKCSAGR